MFIWSTKVLDFDRIDISEGIDTNKKSASKECNICHYWYFLDKNFNYELYLCNWCHDLMQKAMSLMMLLLSLLKEMSETTYYHRNREVILNKAKDYYGNNK